LAGLTAVSLGFYFAGAYTNQSLRYAYLTWNLFLSWLPLLTVALLLRSLRTRLWTHWLAFSLTVLWVFLLPNSFYMISDFIHIQDVPRHNLLYDVVMFTSFIITAVSLGFSSLYLVHAELRKRLRLRDSSVVIGLILFVCSFAIYLGRDLRWNSWDVLLNPAGILFDVSDHLIHPMQHSGMFTTTLSFFVLLGSVYVVGWQLGEATNNPPAPRRGKIAALPELSVLERESALVQAGNPARPKR
jgi:uncharacterized membrane protein